MSEVPGVACGQGSVVLTFYLPIRRQCAGARAGVHGKINGSLEFTCASRPCPESLLTLAGSEQDSAYRGTTGRARVLPAGAAPPGLPAQSPGPGGLAEVPAGRRPAAACSGTRNAAFVIFQNLTYSFLAASRHDS